ncbi:MAG: PASTA domain-containing protein, partial [Janthinobacterium lividum]
TLRDAGFTNVKTEPATTEDSSAKEGQVLSVSPDAGTSVPLTDRVVVTYATGKSKIPDVREFPQAAAEKTLRDAGFSKVSVSRQISSQTPGTVVSQDPDPGGEVSRSTRVRLVIAQPAPPPSPTPPPPTPTDQSPSASPSPTPTATTSESTGG